MTRLKPVPTGSTNTRSVNASHDSSFWTRRGGSVGQRSVGREGDALRADGAHVQVGGRCAGPAVEDEGHRAVPRRRLGDVGDGEDLRRGLLLLAQDDPLRLRGVLDRLIRTPGQSSRARSGRLGCRYGRDRLRNRGPLSTCADPVPLPVGRRVDRPGAGPLSSMPSARLTRPSTSTQGVTSRCPSSRTTPPSRSSFGISVTAVALTGPDPPECHSSTTTRTRLRFSDRANGVSGSPSRWEATRSAGK